MEYCIFPIPLVECNAYRGLDFFRDFSGRRIKSMIYTWLIQVGEQRILVDPGVDAKGLEQFSSAGLTAKEINSFEEGLARFGLKPEDIDIVILTHLHYDHFVNATKCKNARVIVQKSELDFALNPHPLFARSFQAVRFYEEWFRKANVQKIKGDKEIIPGIQLLLTPGHTEGNQSVVIQTSKGKAVISGICTHFEHFFPDGSTKTIYHKGKLPVNIPGLCFDPKKAYDSILKIKEAGEILIPNHDMSFRRGRPIPQQVENAGVSSRQ